MGERLCSYRDCLHRGEPGCAAARCGAGRLVFCAQLESYRAMLDELR